MSLLNNISFYGYKLINNAYKRIKNKTLDVFYINQVHFIKINKEQFGTFSIKIPSENVSESIKNYLLSKYFNHEFNVLGSGWNQLSFNEGYIDKKGTWLNEILLKKHRKKAIKIWLEVVKTKPSYEPIQWQKDIKSNFRFNAKLPASAQRKICPEDVDIKNPWEIARLQHLPQLALFSGNKNEEETTKSIIEFKCQVLDFIMANPLGMGVNWECTMEVGIRIANILLAYDWFKQLDKNQILDAHFQNILLQSTIEHAHYIYHHFEYKKYLTANHYLGNIAGLSFIAAYLESSTKSNRWLALCVQEIVAETQRQFLEDGGNFEGSTSYHRLSAELVAYSTAILENVLTNTPQRVKNNTSTFRLFAPYLKKENFDKLYFSETHFSRLHKIAHFISAYTKLNGNVVQIGDNDSGRFFRLSPIGNFLTAKEVSEKYENITSNEESYWDENDINHSATLCLLNSFFVEENQFLPQSYCLAEATVIKSLIKARKTPLIKSLNNLPFEDINPLQYKKTTTFFSNGVNLTQGLQFDFFNKFGLIVFKSENLFLAINIGTNENGQISWGHQHNDKLSFELNINGEDIVSDPGSYCYTSNPKLRNYFRSTKAHSTISINDEEQNLFPKGQVGLFNYIKRTKTKLLFLSNNKVILTNSYSEYKHFRIFEIEFDRLEITDYCNSEFSQNFGTKLYSNGYGKLLKSE